MYEPAQNYANQLANPYAYNPAQSPAQQGLITGSPYVGGWATAAANAIGGTEQPAPPPTPVVPAAAQATPASAPVMAPATEIAAIGGQGYDPTRNFANQLANPYTYNPAKSPVQRGNLYSPYLGGWASTAAGSIQAGIDEAKAEQEAKTAAATTPVTPSLTATETPTKNESTTPNSAKSAAEDLAKSRDTNRPAPPTGYAPPALNTGETTGLLGQIGLKENLIRENEDANRAASLDATNYDIEGYLNQAKQQGATWGQLASSALIGGLTGGVGGALVAAAAAMIKNGISPSTVVQATPAEVDAVKRTLQNEINSFQATDQSGQGALTPEQEAELEYLTLPADVARTEEEAVDDWNTRYGVNIYGGYLSQVDAYMEQNPNMSRQEAEEKVAVTNAAENSRSSNSATSIDPAARSQWGSELGGSWGSGATGAPDGTSFGNDRISRDSVGGGGGNSHEA